MLKSMRRNTKIVLWVVVAAFVGGFIFIQLGMGGFSLDRYRRARERGVIAEVNGESVMYAQFQTAYQKAYEGAKQQLDGGELDEEAARRLEEEVWNNLITEVLIAQEVRKHNIKITDAEVVNLIRISPPQELIDSPQLQTDGKFDYNKYLQVISNPQNLALLTQYENRIRETLPRQKLQEDILASVHLTPVEVRNAFLARNERVRVSYVFFDPSPYVNAGGAVSEQAIRDYYESHRDDFRVPDRARLLVVTVPKVADRADSAAAQRRAESIYAELGAGKDFGELAMESSDDPTTAARGGDLGFFARGQMAASFEEVAFRLRAGEVSAPFRSPFGWHIVKLEERKREDNEEKVRARHILVKIDPSDATEERGRQRMEEFDRALKKKPFEVASKELDLPVTDTRSFPRGRYVPYVGQNSQAMYFAFEGRIGKTSGLIEDSRGFYELKLVDRKKEGYASIEEARDRLQWLVAREQAKAKAKETAEGFLRELRSSGSLEAAARKFNVPVRSAGPFTREDAVPGVGKGNEFTGTAFSLSVGQVSGAVTTDQGAYVLRVEERLPIDEALFASQRGQLGNELLSQKRNEALQDYLREVQRQARIRDYRGG